MFLPRDSVQGSQKWSHADTWSLAWGRAGDEPVSPALLKVFSKQLVT